MIRPIVMDRKKFFASFKTIFPQSRFDEENAHSFMYIARDKQQTSIKRMDQFWWNMTGL